MIIDCISDLHGKLPELEGGDLLIIAGDIQGSKGIMDLESFFNWVQAQSYRKKVAIAGNHDTILQADGFAVNNFAQCGVDYLFDSSTEFEGLKIFGSPWSLWFHGVNPHCKAFMTSENELIRKYQLIPEDTNILVTHTPAYGSLDQLDEGKLVGSLALKDRIMQLRQLDLHVCGHIHEARGRITTPHKPIQINASILDENYLRYAYPIERVIL